MQKKKYVCRLCNFPRSPLPNFFKSSMHFVNVCWIYSLLSLVLFFHQHIQTRVIQNSAAKLTLRSKRIFPLHVHTLAPNTTQSDISHLAFANTLTRTLLIYIFPNLKNKDRIRSKNCFKLSKKLSFLIIISNFNKRD